MSCRVQPAWLVVLFLCLAWMSVQILGCSSNEPRYPQDHARYERIDRAVESLRKELGEKNRLLERKNRLAALGEMAAGLAHEIRNPLGGIQLYASLLAGDLKGRPDLAGSLAVVHKIAGGVKRLDRYLGAIRQIGALVEHNSAIADVASICHRARFYRACAVEAKSSRKPATPNGASCLEVRPGKAAPG